MNRHNTLIISIVAAAGAMMVSQSMAGIIVNDTWLDGTRSDPYDGPGPYSEFGVDGDLDGDIESAWFAGGSGTFDPVGPGGPLRLDQTTSSASLTTYFTEEGAELTLANPGDWLKVTWQFMVSGQVLPNTSQGLRVALVDSPASSRVVSETSPGDAAYTGYGAFINMDTNLTHSRPLDLMERNVASGALLSSSGAWVSLASDGTNGADGYHPDEAYTFTMQLTRTGAGELDILMSMAGGTVDNDGLMSISFTDTTPNSGSFSFDTFEFRPDGYDRAWEIIDTTSFKVEYVPEPGSVGLMLAGMGLLAATRRSRKS